MRRREAMIRHRHPTVDRILRRLKPFAENFAAAAAVSNATMTLIVTAYCNITGRQLRRSTVRPSGGEISRCVSDLCCGQDVELGSREEVRVVGERGQRDLGHDSEDTGR